MHWCAVSSAFPIIPYESRFCAILTRLSVGYDEGGGTVQQYDERGYEDEGALAVPDGIDPDQDGQG